MPKRKPTETVSVTANNLNVSNGATIGPDRSTGKTITAAESTSLATPVGFLLFALKQLPLLIWGVGVVAIAAMVAIASLWHVPAGPLVIGSIGIFIGMFGLVIFASLVQPAPKGVRPPAVAKVVLWAFAFILIGAGFLSASSVFFDWPIPLRSQMFVKAGK